MFIKISFFAYSVDTAIMPTCRVPGWRYCWWTVELVSPGSPLGRVPSFPGGRGTGCGILIQREDWVTEILTTS